MTIDRRRFHSLILGAGAATAFGTGATATGDHEMKRSYMIGLTCRRAAVAVRINGRTVIRTLAIEAISTSGLATNSVLQGVNDIELEFASLTEASPEDDRILSGPREDFFCEVSLLSSGLSSDTEDERITLFNLAYDMETGTIVERAETHTMAQAITETASLRTTDGIGEQMPGSMYAKGMKPYETIVARKTARIDDPALLSRFHWRSGLRMVETPELRMQLRDAYRRIHDAISANRFDILLEDLAPSWRNAAHTMRMGDLDSFLERSGARDAFSRVPDDGTVLGPFDVRLEHEELSSFMELTDRGRLAQFKPEPIYWVDGEGNVRSSSSIVFYMPEEGVLKPATIVNA